MNSYAGDGADGAALVGWLLSIDAQINPSVSKAVGPWSDAPYLCRGRKQRHRQ